MIICHPKWFQLLQDKANFKKVLWVKQVAGQIIAQVWTIPLQKTILWKVLFTQQEKERKKVWWRAKKSLRVDHGVLFGPKIYQDIKIIDF